MNTDHLHLIFCARCQYNFKSLGDPNDVHYPLSSEEILCLLAWPFQIMTGFFILESFCMCCATTTDACLCHAVLCQSSVSVHPILLYWHNTVPRCLFTGTSVVGTVHSFFPDHILLTSSCSPLPPESCMSLCF